MNDGTGAPLRETPWDKAALGIDTFEILTVSEEALAAALRKPGHYTAKIDPLADKRLLHDHDFYYCDTLLEPYADRQRFIDFPHDRVGLRREVAVEELLAISHGAFAHGRFHRDFQVDRGLADLRYDNWLRQLHGAGTVFGLTFEERLAAFFGYMENRIVLHAVAREFQGQGLAKFLWSRGCRELFAAGHAELTSSVSAANTAVVNLYASLGFRFRHPVDVYHRLVP